MKRVSHNLLRLMRALDRGEISALTSCTILIVLTACWVNNDPDDPRFA